MTPSTVILNLLRSRKPSTSVRETLSRARDCARDSLSHTLRRDVGPKTIRVAGAGAVLRDNIRVPPFVLAAARCGPPIALLLLLRRHPPDAVFNRIHLDSAALAAHPLAG